MAEITTIVIITIGQSVLGVAVLLQVILCCVARFFALVLVRLENVGGQADSRCSRVSVIIHPSCLHGIAQAIVLLVIARAVIGIAVSTIIMIAICEVVCYNPGMGATHL